MATINDVRLDKYVEFFGYELLEGGYSKFVDGCKYVMSAGDAQNFVSELKANNALPLIEESLQGLWLRADGTDTKSAMPTMSEFKAAVTNLCSIPQELIDLLPVWESLGVNEITITFEKKE